MKGGADGGGKDEAAGDPTTLTADRTAEGARAACRQYGVRDATAEDSGGIGCRCG